MRKVMGISVRHGLTLCSLNYDFLDEGLVILSNVAIKLQ